MDDDSLLEEEKPNKPVGLGDGDDDDENPGEDTDGWKDDLDFPDNNVKGEEEEEKDRDMGW